jgi:hypothetical protein
MAVGGPPTRWQHHTIRGAISGALKKKVAQPNQLFLNQGTRNNPLAIRVGNCVFGRSDQPNPANQEKTLGR